MGLTNGIGSFFSQNLGWKGYRGVLRPKEKVETTPPVSCNKVEILKPPLVSEKMFVRLAGVFGASAVIMGAYAAHGFYLRKDVSEEKKKVFQTANQYHFIHTLALLAVPLTNRPYIVGTLLALGMTIFCGTCYIYALTDNATVRKFTPYGGMLLIIGWIAMIL